MSSTFKDKNLIIYFFFYKFFAIRQSNTSHLVLLVIMYTIIILQKPNSVNLFFLKGPYIFIKYKLIISLKFID